MAIIDILTQRDIEAPFFEVNIDAEGGYVPLQYDENYTGLLINGLFYSCFQYKDNFNILSAGIQLPLAFEFYPNDAVNSSPLNWIFFKIRNLEGAFSTLPDTALWLPFENNEINVGKYVDIPSFINTTFELSLNILNPPAENVLISMLNVDESLNGKTFYCPLFCKIQHTLPLILTPGD